MKAQDFRIGNIVNHQEYKSIFKGRITSISPYRIGIDNRTTIKLNSDNLIPIPLTEEWLLRFGFKQGTLKNCYFKSWGDNGVETVVFEYHYKGGFEYEIGEHRHKTIQYVHQLQNLYFASFFRTSRKWWPMATGGTRSAS